MEVLKLRVVNLRNDEHFEFFTEFTDLVNGTGAMPLHIEKLFNTFKTLFAEEDAALKKIVKSDFTRLIHEADETRDMVFRGLTDANRAALNHFNVDVREAAKRMQIVFDTYGNVTTKSVDAESSAVQNLLGELALHHAADKTKAGLDEWTKELQKLNNEVKRLTQERDEQTADRSVSMLREVRLKVDEVYHLMAARIEVFSVMEKEGGEEEEDENGGEIELRAVAAAYLPCTAFVGKLNAVIERYNNRIAIRKGRAKKKGEEKPGEI
jgi:hypothetical protein